MTSWAKKSRKIKKSFGAQLGFLLEYQIMPILQRCMMPYKTVARFMSHRMRKYGNTKLSEDILTLKSGTFTVKISCLNYVE